EREPCGCALVPAAVGSPCLLRHGGTAAVLQPAPSRGLGSAPVACSCVRLHRPRLRQVHRGLLPHRPGRQRPQRPWLAEAVVISSASGARVKLRPRRPHRSAPRWSTSSLIAIYFPPKMGPTRSSTGRAY